MHSEYVTSLSQTIQGKMPRDFFLAQCRPEYKFVFDHHLE